MFSYTPEAKFFGVDSLTYEVNDGELDSGIATVSLSVTAVNEAWWLATGRPSCSETRNHHQLDRA